MFYVGVDGCHFGWLAVKLEEGGSWEVEKFENISRLWDKYKDAQLILIDIPIGLRDGGSFERLCDLEARKLLPKRGGSIFPVPCRPAVYTDRDKASKINKEKTERWLSQQTLNIIPKIREVDELLSADARAKIYETHPEICFCGLNGKKPMRFNKKDERGFAERMTLLHSVYPASNKIVTEALKRYPRKDVAKDDILDALVCAITATKKEGIKSLPEKPEFDARGLPMQIFYYPTSPQSPVPISDLKQAP